MAKLVVSRRGVVIASCFLDAPRLTLGRAPDSNVVLEDGGVSKNHAVIDQSGNDAILHDLGSVNGTAVNGQRVTRHLLHHGDLIEILDYQIRYVDHKSVVAGDGDRTMVFQSAGALLEHGTPAAAKAAPAARAVDIAFARGVLRHVSGKRKGEMVALDRALVVLGRPGVQLAAILRRPSGFDIARVEGPAPRVGGTVVTDGWQSLAHGSRIKVADEDVEIEIFS